MARASTAGMTDYSHQSLEDILRDLSNWFFTLQDVRAHLESEKQKLIENNYWEYVNVDFKQIFNYSFKFFETVTTEINEIQSELSLEIQSHHVARLMQLGKTSHEIYMVWKEVWVNDVNPKQYGNPNFAILERLYNHSCDMVIDLLDLTNVSDRLKDFVGKKVKPEQSSQITNNNIITIHGDNKGNTIIGNDNEVNNEA